MTNENGRELKAGSLIDVIGHRLISLWAETGFLYRMKNKTILPKIRTIGRGIES
ncbi:hypothetical protein [Azospirillum palustre]|uniref:hypothetical protein n=1 Tax=Azospirillum palustre TaxID=2044885 RepID=UPI00137A8104|nr:hypothetical protein [Azospirillum palustre]